MRLLIRREQKTGLLGKSKFSLYVRAQITDVEQDIIRKNGLAGELLLYYERDTNAGVVNSMYAKGGFIGSIGGIVKAMRDVPLTIHSLVGGTTFTCDNVAQLLDVEAEATQAAKNLKRYLEAAASFGGEIAIDIDDAIMQERQKLTYGTA